MSQLNRIVFNEAASNQEQRALQRILVDHFLKLSQSEDNTLPAEAKQLAALQLMRIKKTSQSFHNKAKDDYTIAHYESIQRRIIKELEQSSDKF